MPANMLKSLLGASKGRPAFSVLQMAAIAAQDVAPLDEETLHFMRLQVESEVFSAVRPPDMWAELAKGLMGHKPSRMVQSLHDCGALALVLPEVAALFGVPQSADDPPQVDIGLHTLRVLDEAAQRGAPLAVRFAALVMNVGKSDSPPEHLPAHYRHMDRARPRIERICKRFRVADACRDLALLALAECERVHRAARMRAGSMAAMLERVDALRNPDRFELLLLVCSCDFNAYPRRQWRRYTKADMLRAALDACRRVDPCNLPPPDATEDDGMSPLLQARALAVATALRSARWADPTDDTVD
ncbi:tRNA nucleotidyltransferase [Nitrogeniibacter aestuarii]|uniref:tRNA nucleotidyltransferase n=1 Tax=Nitrogeniibacter aestuarii TaxID=2815343 RepID=UPI001D12D794|nr:tRNA nucleotidyltransferase [Nitrogeniibacter aestuarii]